MHKQMTIWKATADTMKFDDRKEDAHLQYCTRRKMKRIHLSTVHHFALYMYMKAEFEFNSNPDLAVRVGIGHVLKWCKQAAAAITVSVVGGWAGWKVDCLCDRFVGQDHDLPCPAMQW